MGNLPTSIKYNNHFIVRHWEISQYDLIHQLMTDFANISSHDTPDEIWTLQHHPVYTMGHMTSSESILQRSNIPYIPTDRGGQITYHGPGQLIVYPLIYLKRRALFVKPLVRILESAVIQCLALWGVKAHTVDGKPGVFIKEQKVASIGLKIKRGWSMHGLALNINMDLSPFHSIHPCGEPSLIMTDMSRWVHPDHKLKVSSVINQLLPLLIDKLPPLKDSKL